jgi:hypothetical protein
MDRRLLLATLGALLAAPTRLLADPSDCPPGTVWDHDERTTEREADGTTVITVTPICRRKGAPPPPVPTPAASCLQMQKDIGVLRVQMQADSAQAARNSDALDEWSRFSDKAREDVRKEAYKQATELAVEGVLKGIKTLAINDRMITAQDAGLLNSNWKMNVVRLIGMPAAQKAEVLTRLSQARTVEQGATALKLGMKAINASYDAASLRLEPNWENAKKAGLSTLKLINAIAYDNPATGLLIKDLDAGQNALYGWWAVLAARNRLNQFMALEDGALSRAVDRSNRYVALANKLRNDPACRGTV